jgi:hypothetical protein
MPLLISPTSPCQTYKTLWVNIQKTMENQHVEWVNQLFLWPFSIANCNKLPEGFSDGFLGH